MSQVVGSAWAQLVSRHRPRSYGRGRLGCSCDPLGWPLREYPGCNEGAREEARAVGGELGLRTEEVERPRMDWRWWFEGNI